MSATGTAFADPEVGASGSCTDENGDQETSQFGGEGGVKVGTDGADAYLNDAEAATGFVLLANGIADGHASPCDSEDNRQRGDHYFEAHTDSGHASVQFCFSEGYDGLLSGNQSVHPGLSEFAVNKDSKHDKNGHPCEYEG
ncbi:hypothetical protein BRC85_05990 [Halobacteriales archaeon QS_1_69_70]|nr:MAG: hypothetical protein BRC85_05990 [Halobacteriales archaeon QS_1_69_70]